MLTSTSAMEGYATEEGGCGVKINLFDTDGTTAITPTADPKWALTNVAGEVINSRESETIAAGESVTPNLSGPDLALPEGKESARFVIVTGIYDSLTLGDDTKFVHQHKFYIKPVQKKTIWPA